MFRVRVDNHNDLNILHPAKNSTYIPCIPAHHHGDPTFQNLSAMYWVQGVPYQPENYNLTMLFLLRTCICYHILPAVMLSPRAITTLMSCGRSSCTFFAGFDSGGSSGQLKFTWSLPRPAVQQDKFLCNGHQQTVQSFTSWKYRQEYKHVAYFTHLLLKSSGGTIRPPPVLEDVDGPAHIDGSTELEHCPQSWERPLPPKFQRTERGLQRCWGPQLNPHG